MKELYLALRKIPVAVWQKADASAVAKELALDGVFSLEEGFLYRVAGKLAHHFGTYDEFEQALGADELPPIKLTADEMNVLSGGVSGTQMVKTFLSFGWQAARQNGTSHKIMSYLIDGVGKVSQPIPMHRELAKGTAARLLKVAQNPSLLLTGLGRLT